MSRSQLHEVVAERLDLSWGRFRQAHPHLAAAVERVDLVESAVDSLREDDAFRRAMAQARIDEATLVGASRALRIIDEAVGRVLGL